MVLINLFQNTESRKANSCLLTMSRASIVGEWYYLDDKEEQLVRPSILSPPFLPPHVQRPAAGPPAYTPKS